MEMGSGSLPESAGSSTDSLHALKFGQKIYFQDAAAAGGGGTTMETPPPPMTGLRRKSRVAGGVVHGGQPPRCQVEGCRVDLSDAKAYYSKHKVCGIHSKSPKVIVAGLEQRFCQQCSRFHQLPEFDQEKRSCRRRLAGHNARRRKPSPGSLLPSCYTRLSSSVIDDYDAESSGRGASFTIDFTAYPRLPKGDSWPAERPLDRIPRNRNTAPWQNNSVNPPGDIFHQDSLVGTGFSGTAISPGECFPGVGDSSCALSLLSNQPWGSRTRAPTLEVNDMMNSEGSLSPAQPPTGPTPHDVVVNPYSHASWGLPRTSEPANVQHFGRLELPQQNGRQFIELEQQSRSYDTSTPDIHWSL